MYKDVSKLLKILITMSRNAKVMNFGILQLGIYLQAEKINIFKGKLWVWNGKFHTSFSPVLEMNNGYWKGTNKNLGGLMSLLANRIYSK